MVSMAPPWESINRCDYWVPNLSVYKKNYVILWWTTFLIYDPYILRVWWLLNSVMPDISLGMISIMPQFNVGHMEVTMCHLGNDLMTHSLIFLPYWPNHPSFPSMGLYIVKRPLLFAICRVFDSPPGHSVLAGRLWSWRVPPLAGSHSIGWESLFFPPSKNSMIDFIIIPPTFL